MGMSDLTCPNPSCYFFSLELLSFSKSIEASINIIVTPIVSQMRISVGLQHLSFPYPLICNYHQNLLILSSKSLCSFLWIPTMSGLVYDLIIAYLHNWRISYFVSDHFLFQSSIHTVSRVISFQALLRIWQILTFSLLLSKHWHWKACAVSS